MAGKKHHHVWKFIQNGFGQQKYNDHHVWVFSANSAPRQTVTRTNWVDKFFYGEEDSFADKNITEFEANYVSYIRNVRGSLDNTELDPTTIAPLISLIEMRSAFLRIEISRIIERLIMGLQRKMNSPEFLGKLVQSYLKSNPEYLDAELKKFGANEKSGPALTEIFFKELTSLIRKRKGELFGLSDGIFEGYLTSIAKIAKDAHIKSLQSSFAETGRTKIHENLKYKVLQYSDDDSLILPDTGVAFILKNGLRPFTSKGDEIEALFLPISSTCMIVGYKRAIAQRSPATIKSILASCSFESFIAKDLTTDNAKIANKIGRSARLLEDFEIDAIVNSTSL